MKSENIFLFVPNLIGFARVLLAFVSCYFMLHDPITASILYMLSVGLDCVDGIAARRLNQCTIFGGTLDVVTDSCTAACLNMVLCVFYTEWLHLFQFLVVLDVSSTWIYTCSSGLHGKASFKAPDSSTHPLMHFYYSRPFFDIIWTGRETFFLFLYISHFSSGPLVPILGYRVGAVTILVVTTLPFMVVANLFSVVKLVEGCRSIASLDVVARSRQKQHS